MSNLLAQQDQVIRDLESLDLRLLSAIEAFKKENKTQAADVEISADPNEKSQPPAKRAA